MNRIKELRIKNQMNQIELARKLFVSQSAISSWELGTRDIDTDNLKKISDIFNVSIDYILGNQITEKKIQNSNISYKELAVYGKFSAGNGYNLKMEIRKENIVILPGETMPDNSFMIEISDDSMYPILMIGDLALVNPNYGEIKNNKIYVVTYKEKSYITRVSIKEEYIILKSDNPDKIKYEEIVILKRDFSDFECNGVVFESKRKFK